VGRFAALALVGAAGWLWHWRAAQQRLAREPASERAAPPRRFYLYGSLAGAVIALLVSLAVVLYRALAAVLDVTESGRFLDHVGAPLGVALVAGVIAAYHGQLLRGELAAEPRAAAPAPVTLALTLHGPAIGDADAVLTMLRAQLPPGWELRNER
jgi:hypothetical protein